MKKKIAELYYTTFRNHLSTGSKKVRDTAYDMGYQVSKDRNDLGYYEVYPNTAF